MFATNLLGPQSVLVGFIFGGGYEWVIVAGVFILLFGSAKLPQLFRNMGRSVNEFKAGMETKPSNLEDASDDAESPQTKETADV